MTASWLSTNWKKWPFVAYVVRSERSGSPAEQAASSATRFVPRKYSFCIDVHVCGLWLFLGLYVPLLHFFPCRVNDGITEIGLLWCDTSINKSPIHPLIKPANISIDEPVMATWRGTLLWLHLIPDDEHFRILTRVDLAAHDRPMCIKRPIIFSLCPPLLFVQ